MSIFSSISKLTKTSTALLFLLAASLIFISPALAQTVKDSSETTQKVSSNDSWQFLSYNEALFPFSIDFEQTSIQKKVFSQEIVTAPDHSVAYHISLVSEAQGLTPYIRKMPIISGHLDMYTEGWQAAGFEFPIDTAPYYHYSGTYTGYFSRDGSEYVHYVTYNRIHYSGTSRYVSYVQTVPTINSDASIGMDWSQAGEWTLVNNQHDIPNSKVAPSLTPNAIDGNPVMHFYAQGSYVKDDNFVQIVEFTRYGQGDHLVYKITYPLNVKGLPDFSQAEFENITNVGNENNYFFFFGQPYELNYLAEHGGRDFMMAYTGDYLIEAYNLTKYDNNYPGRYLQYFILRETPQSDPTITK